MTDIELMEQAARAAGLDVHRGERWQSDMLFRAVPRPNSPLVANVEWNPLADDGDALRLAVALLLDVRHVHGKAHAGMQDEFWCTEAWFPNGAPAAATRRAITRAAAALAGAAPGGA